MTSKPVMNETSKTGIFYRDPIREMERAARRLLRKSPGIIFPGWFWQEWVLVFGAIAVIGAVISLVCILVGTSVAGLASGFLLAAMLGAAMAISANAGE